MDFNNLAVVWPDRISENIFEVRFSYEFCRKTSRKSISSLPGNPAWISGTKEVNVQTILHNSDADGFLIVNDPELVLSPPSVTRLLDTFDTGYDTCVPVYNESSHSRQVMPPPYLYYDLPTLLEISQLQAGNPEAGIFAVRSFDPACVMCRRASLERLDRQLPIAAIPARITGEVVVDSGAYVHRFVSYGNSARDDLVLLVPEKVKTVLDVGCARGGYGRSLKESRSDIFLTGVELNPLMAESARQYYDHVINASIETVKPAEQYDHINCGDIIEHLHNPWETLHYLAGMLKTGGSLVMSLPNASHWSIVKGLMQGRFEYIPAGLLCVAHIRWFTETSIKNALKDAGFAVDVFQREQNMPTPEGSEFIKYLCAGGYGDEDALMTHEFTIRAKKTGKI